MILKELRKCVKISEKDDKWLQVPEQNDNQLLLTDLVFEIYGDRNVKAIRCENDSLVIEIHDENISLGNYDYKSISVPVYLLELGTKSTFKLDDMIVEKFSDRIIRDVKISIDYNTKDFCVKIVLKEEC